VVDDLCPMKNTVSEIELKRKGKKVIELLQRLDNEATSRGARKSCVKVRGVRFKHRFKFSEIYPSRSSDNTMAQEDLPLTRVAISLAILFLFGSNDARYTEYVVRARICL